MDTDTKATGVYARLLALPHDQLLTLPELAAVLNKCEAAIRSSIKRGEIAKPVRVMGKATWSVRSILRHIEGALDHKNGGV